MRYVVLLLIFLLIAGCNKGDGEVVNKFVKDQAFTEALEKLSTRTVYFGHQSVGYNIMDGITDIHDGKLTLIDLEKEELKDDGNPAFLHGKIGENFYPLKKMEDFEKKVGSLTKKMPQIAVVKFCFVDVDRTSNVKKLTDAYDTMVKSFKEKYPKISLVHTTVPLTPIGGIKGKIKILIKSILNKEDSNINRMKYNEHVRNNYGNENLFDLAKLESTYGSGKTRTGSKKGFDFEIMIEEYNLDVGHFNELGRQFIAGEFIKFLANVSLADNEKNSETQDKEKVDN